MMDLLRRSGARGSARRTAASPFHSLGRVLRGIAALGATVAVLGACTEDLETKAACPSLCPNQDVTVRDTVLEPVILDTTLTNYPGKGAESILLVANQPGVLDTRAVIRFDSVLRKFDRSTTDTAVVITTVTKARVRFSMDTASVIPGAFTVNVYDVDTPEIDPSDAAVLGAFDAGVLLGSVTFASKADVLGDTISVPLDPAKIAARVTGGKRLRLGVRVSSASPTRLRLNATTGTTGGLSPVLYYDPTDSTDAIAPIVLTPQSLAPAASSSLEFNIRDYTVVAQGGVGALASDEIAVGGLPGRRVYMRFDLPPTLLDSTTIVRATLLLTQRPAPGNGSSTVTLVPMLGLAGRDITDPSRAAQIAIGPESPSTLLTKLALDPTASGPRTLEIAGVVRNYWRSPIYDTSPRALVLRVDEEGFQPGELHFYSTEAADPNVRPRLRITYVPSVTFGLP